MRKTSQIITFLALFTLLPTAAQASSVYVVNPGDTLSKIAREHQTTVHEIMQANQLTSDRLSIGQALTLPGASTPEAAAAPAATVPAPQVVAASSSREEAPADLQNVKRAKVTADVLNVRSAPSTDADIIGKLYYGSVVRLVDSGGEWTKIKYDRKEAYVATEFLEAVRTSSKANAKTDEKQLEELEELIEPLLHTPYILGGTTPAGFDCSGFTRYVFEQLGVSLPRTSAEQFRGGEAVSLEDARPGDLLFYDTLGKGQVSHVAIYLGDDLVVHATGEEVAYGRISYMHKLYPFYGVKRYLQ